MDGTRKRNAVLAAIGGLAVTVAAVTVFAVYQDVIGTRDSDLISLLRGSVPLLLNGLLLWFAYRWVQDDRSAADYVTVAQWMAAGITATGGIVLWLSLLDALGTQQDLLVVIANTVSIGAIGGLISGIYDADRRVQLQNAERERTRISALFENSTDSVLRADFADGDVVVRKANPRFEDVFGVPAADAAGRPLREVVAPAGDEVPVEADAGNWSAEEHEVARETPTGTRDFILRLIPVDAGSGPPTEGFAVYTDITEQKRRERELEEYKDDLQTAVRKLERSNEELEQFAYVASHDLQEPLRMVASYVDLLEVEYGDELDEHAQEYIEYAVNGANRMQQMIDDLLTFSRVGEQNLDVERVDADSVLDDVLEDLHVQIEESDATVTVEDLPELTADRGQLLRAFQNLIANAINYSGDEPPQVHVGVEDDGDEYVFTVEDEGVGIPPDQQDRVFDIFMRGERNDDDEGTGIGLTLCKRIVNAHNGKITLESVPDEGTTFYIRLPKNVQR
jgi:chemotaxis family two-component system sensor kinase Cph1